MQAQTFYKVVTMDRSDFADRLFALLDENQVRYCVIDGQAVNAYVEPVVSLDVDLVIAAEQQEQVETLLSQVFTVKRFSHSINVSAPNSGLRVQIQTDPRYAEFVLRAETRNVLDKPMKVAALEDVLKGKVWAAQDPTRRGSKHLKDLADIARLLEAHPHLRAQVPAEILKLLV